MNTGFTDIERARLHATWCSAPRKQKFEDFISAALLGLEIGLRRQSVDLQRLSRLISSIQRNSMRRSSELAKLGRDWLSGCDRQDIDNIDKLTDDMVFDEIEENHPGGFAGFLRKLTKADWFGVFNAETDDK